ncbi:hypothetical protein Agabi119p4_9236 [Agaricus bisporus var. burnettii]|uniref:Uncharacterized protein n=1 Tax=Agaricus bisporus var. burnettii TaxID=192524 RepID=A0A8H7C5M5_AGABI|nr:hypothetical protein Agabi119p4_9236 [Agaricus bisporus var. burnettii]
MFDFGVRARAPQSSKARQWVELHKYTPGGKVHPQASGGLTLFLSASTNSKSRVGLLTTTQITEGDFHLAPLTVVPRRCCSGAGGDDSAVRQFYIHSRSSIKNNS